MRLFFFWILADFCQRKSTFGGFFLAKTFGSALCTGRYFVTRTTPLYRGGGVPPLLDWRCGPTSTCAYIEPCPDLSPSRWRLLCAPPTPVPGRGGEQQVHAYVEMRLAQTFPHFVRFVKETEPNLTKMVEAIAEAGQRSPAWF